MDEKALFGRLDRIIELLETAGRKPSLGKRIVDGIATGISIMSILAVIEIIRSWIGG